MHIHKCSMSKSWQAQTLTLTLMSLTDTVSNNSPGRETKSAKLPATCQQQQACINMRKSSVERWGHMGNSLPLLWQKLLSYKDGQPLCQPVHLFSIEPMQTALLWSYCFIRSMAISDQRFGFNISRLEVFHSQITCCCCCQQCFLPPVISFSCCLSQPTAQSHGPHL